MGCRTKRITGTASKAPTPALPAPSSAAKKERRGGLDGSAGGHPSFWVGWPDVESGMTVDSGVQSRAIITCAMLAAIVHSRQRASENFKQGTDKKLAAPAE